MKITNKGAEKYIEVSPKNSILIDTAGESYIASSGDVGGKGGSLRATITQGIDYSASITFKNIPKEVAAAQLLTIWVSGDKFQFRNVSF